MIRTLIVDDEPVARQILREELESFPDIAIESLERILPHKNALILIYCNNNFVNAPGPFPSKLPSASLNLSTYIALYDYGYRNVYELGPLIDIASSRLEFEPRSARP